MYRRVLFIGSKESGLKVLRMMFELSPQSMVGCITVDDSDDIRSKLDDYRDYCNSNNLDLDILRGKCDLSEAIKKHNPDLCFVMGWYYLIPDHLLKMVRGGFIGIHNSLLPRHRGFSPLVWAMIAGECETGFSVFSIEKGMDTGDIWYQGKVTIENTDYISDVLKKVDDMIAVFFRDKYLDLLSEKIKPAKQINEHVSYGARRTAIDGTINWNDNASRIYNFIRAQSHPYPGAYTSYKGNKCTIWQASLFPYPIQGRPGQVGLIDRDMRQAVITCGEDTGLIISEIEMEDSFFVITDIVKSLDFIFGE